MSENISTKEDFMDRVKGAEELLTEADQDLEKLLGKLMGYPFAQAEVDLFLGAIKVGKEELNNWQREYGSIATEVNHLVSAKSSYNLSEQEKSRVLEDKRKINALRSKSNKINNALNRISPGPEITSLIGNEAFRVLFQREYFR